MAAVKSASDSLRLERRSATNTGLACVPESHISVEGLLGIFDPVTSGLERFPLGLVLGAFFAGFLGLLLG
jgi:hypothetical protein